MEISLKNALAKAKRNAKIEKYSLFDTILDVGYSYELRLDEVVILREKLVAFCEKNCLYSAYQRTNVLNIELGYYFEAVVEETVEETKVETVVEEVAAEQETVVEEAPVETVVEEVNELTTEKHTFENTYTDLYDNEKELTEEELKWFYSVVEVFNRYMKRQGFLIQITNRNHELLKGKGKEAIGLHWTTDRQDLNAEQFITIDNCFIHDCYEEKVNGTWNLHFCSLEKAIAHEIAHRFYWRHGKNHTEATEAILNEFLELNEQMEEEVVEVEVEEQEEPQEQEASTKQATQPNEEDIILKNDILVVRIKTLVSCYNRWKKIAKSNDSCGDFVKEYQYQLEAILNLINAMGIWTSYSQDCNDYIYKVMIGKQKIDCSDCIPE